MNAQVKKGHKKLTVSVPEKTLDTLKAKATNKRQFGKLIADAVEQVYGSKQPIIMEPAGLPQ